METAAPRFLYLHGFASGPQSTKGTAVAAHFLRLGVAVERLDLRRPSMADLRLSAMIQHTRDRIGGDRDRAVVFGSSLGGLTALWSAQADPRICAVVALAPALGLLERWRARLGEEAWEAFRRSGSLEVDDHATKGRARVGYGFVEDVAAFDREGPPDVRVPTLIFHGARDEVVDVGRSREWASGKRHVRLVELADGHELTASLPTILEESERFLAPFLHGGAP